MIDDLIIQLRVCLGGGGLEIDSDDRRVRIGFGLDRIEDGLELLLVASQQNDVGAMSGKRARRTAADAVARARDEHGATRQQISGRLVPPVRTGDVEFGVRQSIRV